MRNIRVWGDKKDKEELYNRLIEDKNVSIRKLLLEVIDPPLAFTVVFGLISSLKIIYDLLKEKKDKNIEVQISYSDGRVVTVKSTNPDKLRVLIQELTEKEE